MKNTEKQCCLASSKLSGYRVKMRKLIAEQQKLGNIIMNRDVLLKGTVYNMKTRCGKPGCKCVTEGLLHTAWRITRSHHGKPQAKCLGKEKIYEYQKLTWNYSRFRQARARLTKIYREQMKLINLIETAKREDSIFEQ